MPIRPELRWFYPMDWLQLSAIIRFERAKGRCPCCGRPHGKLVYHLGDGRWFDEERHVWRSGKGRVLSRLPPQAGTGGSADIPMRTTRVVLATAHLDHDPTNNRSRNLKALCQRCHMLHDQVEHRRQRFATLFKRKASGDLFLGPYARGPQHACLRRHRKGLRLHQSNCLDETNDQLDRALVGQSLASE
jgi:hypothetical protein